MLIGFFLTICIDASNIRLHPETAKITFSVTHIGKTTVYGQFNAFDGIILVKNNQFIKAQGKILIDSIETNNKVRNAYLKSKKFFDRSTYPYIYFYSDSFNAVPGGLIAKGKLNIYGVTQNVELKFTHDKEKNQLRSQTALNRFDYNLRRHKRMIGATVNVQLMLNVSNNIKFQ